MTRKNSLCYAALTALFFTTPSQPRRRRLTLQGVALLLALSLVQAVMAQERRDGPPAEFVGPPSREAQAGGDDSSSSGTAERASTRGRPLSGDGRITVNLREANIDQILKFISDNSGMPVILQNDLTAKINVVSPSPMPVAEALGLIYDALLLQDIVVVDAGDKLAIVKADKASVIPVAFDREDEVGIGGALIMKFRPLEYAEPDVIVQSVKPLVGPGGNVQAIQRTRSILITAPRGNVEQIESIIAQLDVPEAKDVVLRIFSLRYAEANTVATLINRIVRATTLAPAAGPSAAEPEGGRGRGGDEQRNQAEGGRAPGRGPGGNAAYLVIEPDTRNNRLIVAAPAATMPLIEELLTKLDEERPDTVTLHRLEISSGNIVSLASLIEEIYRARSSSQSASEQVRAIPHLESGSLFLLCSEEKFQEIRQLAETMRADEALVMELFFLKHASAESLSSILEDLLRATTQLTAGAAPSRGRRSSDSGREGLESSSMFRTLAESLLSPAGVGAQPTVFVDPRLNALIVIAPAEGVARVGSLLELLDVDRPLDVDVRFIELQHTDGNDAARALGDAFSQLGGGRGGGRGRGFDGLVDRTIVQISATRDGRGLIVLSSEDNYKRVLELARQIDDRGDVQLRKVRVAYHDTAVFANMLMQALQSIKGGANMPTITPHLDGQSLLVMSTEEDFKSIEALVADLDKSQEITLRTFELKFADAQELTTLITQALQAGFVAEGGQTSRQMNLNTRTSYNYNYGQTTQSRTYQATYEPGAKIFPETRTNSLVVVGSPEDIEVVADLIDQFDRDTPDDVTIRAIDLQYARASDVARSLQTVFSRLPRRDDRDIVQITATADDKRLVALSSEENFRRIGQLVADLDKKDTAELTVIRLEYADATELASVLGSMLNTGVGGRGTASRPRTTTTDTYQVFGSGGEGMFTTISNVTIIAETRINALMIAAAAEDLKVIQNLVENLDRPREEQLTIHHEYLQFADAPSVMQAAAQFFQPASRSPRDQMTIIANSMDNSLMVMASEENWSRIKEFISQIDREDSVIKGRKTYQLQYVDAKRLAEQLTALYQQTSGLNDYWSFIFGGASTTTENYNFVPSPMGNQLMVMVPPQEIPMLDEIIAQMDTPETLEAMRPSVYYIKHTSAADMRDILLELFQSGQASTQSSTGFSFYRPTAASEQMVSSMIGEVNFVVDRDANALIAFSSNPSNIQIVDRLIHELDTQAPEFSNTEILQLEYADSLNMAILLNTLYGGSMPRQGGQGGQAGGQGQQQGGNDQDSAFGLSTSRNSTTTRADYSDLYYWWQAASQQAAAAETQRPISTLIEQVRIVPDIRTNSLVVTAASHHLETIRALIVRLDRSEPQVLIRARLIEILRDDEKRAGLRFTPDPTTVRPEELSNAITALGSLNLLDTFGSKIPSVDGSPLTVDTAARTGGFQNSLTRTFDEAGRNILSADINIGLLIQLLQMNTESNVLSTPMLTVDNNETGTIFVGQDVPYITDSQVSAQGTRNDSFQYTEVGTKLDITPHINAKKQVVLEIDLQDMSIREGETILGGFIFNRLTYSTAVAIENQQTLVLGGILRRDETEMQRKVPLLGDIPFAGKLFRKTDQLQAKRELVAFVTPEVIWNRYEADLTTQNIVDDVLKDYPDLMPGTLPEVAPPTEEQKAINAKDDARTSQELEFQHLLRDRAWERPLNSGLDSEAWDALNEAYSTPPAPRPE